MSDVIYPLPPYPSLQDPDIRVCDRAVAESLIDRIRTYGDAMIERYPLPARVGFHEQTREIQDKRKAVTQWLPKPQQDPTVRWIYDLTGEILQHANAQTWQYDIMGFHDALHYVQYHAPSDHFSWHQDRGDDWRRPQRKLSFSLLLSDPSEYEGGELQIFNGREITIAPRAKGTIYIFPSFIQHRVLPITQGCRRALIGWACGPRFK